MIVTLTTGQLEALNRLDLGPETRQALGWHHYTLSERKICVEAPAAAWVIARERLIDYCFTAAGGKRKQAPHSAVRALTVIAGDCARRAVHPAIRRMVVVGAQVDVIPVWMHGDDEEPSLIPPAQPAEFRILTPQLIERPGGVVLTAWEPKSPHPGGSWLCQEATHLRLRGEMITALRWEPQVHAGDAD